MRSRRTRNLTATTLVCAVALLSVPATAAALKVTWMKGFAAPGTPAKYDKVGVIKVGPAKAKNVLVLAPGTSAGSAYFVPLAQWLVSKLPGWQVWSEERRENLLEDQSVLNLAKRGKASAQRVFDYYLGYLTDPSITNDFKFVPDASVAVRQAMGDERGRAGPAPRDRGSRQARRQRRPRRALARRLLWLPRTRRGTSMAVPAPTTWMVSSTSTVAACLQSPRADATAALTTLSGRLPVAVVRRHRRAVRRAVQRDRLARRAAGTERTVARAAVPGAAADLKPSVPVTNLGQQRLRAERRNVAGEPGRRAGPPGKGVTKSAKNGLHGWDGTGALTPIKRSATMFSGIGINNVDGDRVVLPAAAHRRHAALSQRPGEPRAGRARCSLNDGTASLRGRRSTRSAPALGGQGVLLDAQQLAKQSHIPGATWS